MDGGAILVTGATGQVGGAVAKLARAQGRAVWAPTRLELDLTDVDALEAAVSSRRWASVMNCAAYTAVDRAEEEPALACAVNTDAPAALARACASASVPLIHLSTDYVFNGRKQAPYVEDDAVDPLGVYGRTKEAGEAAVRAANPRHAILRTSWVLSAAGANFLNTMLRLGAERDEVRVVADQIGCPTSADDLAHALLTIGNELGERAGTWHFANAGEASWHGLATHIFEAARRAGLKAPAVEAITTAQYPTPAHRPANSRLATGKLLRDFDIAPRPWQEAVDTILAERLG